MPQQIASFLLALLVGAAPIATVQSASSAATLARLEVRITTTATWTSVTLSPGRVAAARVVSMPSGVKLSSQANGWTLNNSSGKARSVVVRAVFEEPTGAANIRVTVRKAFKGKTVVDVQNLSAKPFLAARLENRLPQYTNGKKASDGVTAVLTRTRGQIFGAADPAVAVADPNRLVLAAYYPWFGAGYGNPQFTARPSDPRSTTTYPDVLSMTQQARDAGVDGFVVSWQGEAAFGQRFDLALAAARQTAGVVTPYIEMAHANTSGGMAERADPLVVLQWLSDVLDRADNPAFLRSGGIPVVFVWETGRLSRLGWLNVLAELEKRGKPVRLVGDAPMENWGMVQWGIHEYNPNPYGADELALRNRRIALDARILGAADAAGPHLYVATVSPGYDDSNLPDRVPPLVVERGPAGERYQASWDAALQARPDWILITSWNEWFEGTSIEPSHAFGDTALRQTAEMAAVFSG